MKNVAIVGGGIAGLTCAFRLKELGVPATVFEAAEKPGGRSSAGPYLLGPAAYANTFALADTLGLRSDLIEIKPIAGQFYKGRVYHHRVSSVMGLLGFKGLNIADKAMLSRMAYFLVRHTADLDFHHPERGAAAFDHETVATFVKRELSQNILNYIAGPLISTLFFYSSEETSALLYMNLAKYMYNTHMYTVRGGLGRIGECLAERVGVRCGEKIVAISPGGEHYLVNGREFSDVAVATSGAEVLGIAGMRELLAHEDCDFFDNCRYGRAVSVTVETQESDACYAISIPRVERMRAATIIMHRFIDPESSGMTVIGGGDSVTSEELVADVQRIYPGQSGSSQGREWTCAMPKFPPGRFREIGSFLTRERRPGLFFCGDYLMGPFLEASVTTGLRVADAIKARL